MGDTKPIRAFLAIELPQDTHGLIESVKERLRPALKGIRWTRAEGMHLTLRFFGNIFPDDVDRISEVVERNTGDVVPMELALNAPGVFPSLKRPRVLWLGVGGETDRLTALQVAIERDLEKELGFPGEGRSFKAHLTLGRAQARGGTISGVSDLLEMAGDLSAHRFDARELILFRSELKPGGAVYTKLARFPFGGTRQGDG
ncbi:MAG: RNA 2',3'-cyclic phosphodiesterase [Syntrophales bacterium]|nr:RNA 2',3'-cyclic phosphodiesterase [Syntrophales bacterium]